MSTSVMSFHEAFDTWSEFEGLGVLGSLSELDGGALGELISSSITENRPCVYKIHHVAYVYQR